jgi:hypothetical protein
LTKLGKGRNVLGKCKAEIEGLLSGYPRSAPM